MLWDIERLLVLWLRRFVNIQSLIRKSIGVARFEKRQLTLPGLKQKSGYVKFCIKPFWSRQNSWGTNQTVVLIIKIATCNCRKGKEGKMFLKKIKVTRWKYCHQYHNPPHVVANASFCKPFPYATSRLWRSFPTFLLLPGEYDISFLHYTVRCRTQHIQFLSRVWQKKTHIWFCWILFRKQLSKNNCYETRQLKNTFTIFLCINGFPQTDEDNVIR